MWGKARGALYLRGGIKSILLEGTQAMPARPSDKDRMCVRERVRKDSIRAEEKRKHLGESERRFISEGEKEHLVRRYPGNARSSF
jgi:hypothetical protein